MTDPRPIINTHDQLVAAGGGVALVKIYSNGRDTYVEGWAVYRMNGHGQKVVTNPDAAWYDHGCKTFRLFQRPGTFADKMRLAATEACMWVSDQGWYDGAWVGNRSGDKVPADINKRFPIRRR